MAVENIYVEQMIGSFKGEGYKGKKEYNFDRYNVEIYSGLSTKEFSVVVDHLDKTISGDCIRYGSWGDLDEEEILEILAIVEEEGKVVRPYENYTIEGV
jgi:hypothetical protein